MKTLITSLAIAITASGLTAEQIHLIRTTQNITAHNFIKSAVVVDFEGGNPNSHLELPLCSYTRQDFRYDMCNSYVAGSKRWEIAE